MIASTTPAPARDGRSARDGPSALRAQFGMYVFLASDLMLFAPFFAAYYLLRTNVDAWPPDAVHLDTVRATAATATLVASSGTLAVAHAAARMGDLVRVRRWVIVTVALGAVFLANQLAEYGTLDFRAADGTYSSIYWLLTGLHTVHVGVGLLVLVAIVARTFRVAAPEDLDTWLDGGGAFWHLVDGVWVAVFLTIWIVR